LNLARQIATARDVDFLTLARANFAGQPREEWRASRALEDARDAMLERGSRPNPITVSMLRREFLNACCGTVSDFSQFIDTSIVVEFAETGRVSQEDTIAAELLHFEMKIKEIGGPKMLALSQLLSRERLGLGEMMRASRASASAPVDLWARREAPELPTGLLPKVIEEFAIRQGYIMGADPAGIAMSALAVCGGAISDSISVQPKLHDITWREAPRLWVALVGLPSMKKSPSLAAAVAPLQALDNARVARYRASPAIMPKWPHFRRSTKRPKR
jgi:hypothetical protein